MKKYQYIFAALLAVAACQKNEVTPEAIEEEPVWGYVTAEVSTTAVKGVLVDGEEENTLDFKWEVGDKIRMAVNKGTLETPDYAWRNGYIYSVNEGEHTVTIKYDKGTGANIANYIVGAWYPWLDKENSEPTAIRTTQDYSTGKVSIPLHATNVSTENPIDVGTAAGADAELAQKLVFGPYNPGGTAYSVLGFRLTKGGAERTVKSIKVNNGSQDYTLTNINTALTGDVQYFYIVLPASDTPLSNFKATITANDGDNDLVYTRTKSSYTPTAGKVTRFPVIADLDNTGRHFWDLSSSATNAGEPDFPFWFHSNTRSYNDNIDHGAECMTVTGQASGDKYRADIAPIVYTNPHVYVCKTRGTVVADGDKERLAIHAGNYPVFAIMMTNPTEIGTSRNFIIDTNSKVEEGMAVRFAGRIGNGANKQSVLTNESYTDRVIVYFDLSSTTNAQNKIATSVVPDTRALYFYSWQVQVADIVDTSVPKYKVWWAGTFNSKNDLINYADGLSESDKDWKE